MAEPGIHARPDDAHCAFVVHVEPLHAPPDAPHANCVERHCGGVEPVYQTFGLVHCACVRHDPRAGSQPCPPVQAAALPCVAPTHWLVLTLRTCGGTQTASGSQLVVSGLYQPPTLQVGVPVGVGVGEAVMGALQLFVDRL